MENNDSNEITFFRFEDLRVYHKSLDYHNWMINACRLFPDEESNFITDQLLRSSLNISHYIVEGSAHNKSQFIHYLKQAKSSVRESVIHTSIAEKQGFFSEIQVEESRNELMELTKMIGALIGSLQKANNNRRDRNTGRNNYHEYGNETISAIPSDVSEYTNNNY